MPLDRVTITGADNRVPICDMMEISARFPFIEWGILISSSRSGTARYPNTLWLTDLARLADANPEMKICLHLCGSIARQWFAGTLEYSELTLARHVAQRIQVNGKPAISRDGEEVPPSAIHWPARVTQYILQYPACAALFDDCALGFAPLFDESGGMGIAPKEAPSGLNGLYCGYAGGIGPDNITSRIEEIQKFNPLRFWIDMESGVRTNDELDLDKVRDVLRKASAFTRQAAGVVG